MPFTIQNLIPDLSPKEWALYVGVPVGVVAVAGGYLVYSYHQRKNEEIDDVPASSTSLDASPAIRKVPTQP